MVREPDATTQPTLQDNQLMSKHGALDANELDRLASVRFRLTRGRQLRVISAVLNVNGSLLVHYDNRTFSRSACFKGANGGLKKSSRIIASELSLQLH
jgi:hypothetical protein